MEPGWFRVHMMTRDDDKLTLLAALDAEGRINESERQPFLLKTVWDGRIWMGALVFQRDAIFIEWGGDVPSSLTDLDAAPVRVGAVFRIHDGDDARTETREFIVRAVDRLN